MPATRPIEIRFWEKVDVLGPQECWNWKGATVPGGYGAIRADLSAGVRTNVSAHRWAYEQENGPVPQGKIVRHTCDNPRCVNAAHLILGTHNDNMADVKSRGRGRRLSAEKAKEIHAQWKSGVSQNELSRQWGIDRSTIKRALDYAEQGDFGGAQPCAARNAYAKVTSEMAAEMVRLVKSGVPVMAVSKRFGVSRIQVRRYTGPSQAPLGRPRRAVAQGLA